MKKWISIFFCLSAIPIVGFCQLRMPAARDSVAVQSPHFVATMRSTCGNVQPVPKDEYARHLPFFCRQELKMQQAHIPVTFRVGTMDQCNYLEQKPGYR